jgi:hypothetical protein
MEWHWGQIVSFASLPNIGGPPGTHGPAINVGIVPIQFRFETAAVLRPEDATDAEIIRPAYDDSPASVTLSLTLSPSAASRLRDQMATRGGQTLFAMHADAALPTLGGLMPMLTSDGRLLLTGLIDRDELWPAAAGVLRRTLQGSLMFQASDDH